MDLLKAVNSGYSADQVLEFLVSSFPYLGRRLRQAIKLGHDAKSIIGSFQGLSKEKLKELDDKVRSVDIRENPVIQGQEATRRSSARGQIEETASNLRNIGLAAGGAYLAGRALQNVPQLTNLLSRRGLPKAPGSTTQQMAPEILEETQETLSPTPTTEPSVEPQKRRASDLIKEMGLEQRIKNLSGNNPPQIVGAAIKSMLTPGQKTWLKNQTNQPIEEIVNEYLQEKPAEEITEKLVVTPNGEVGDLIEERQGIGSVKLPSGEIRRRKLADLAEEPPELAKQINDVIASLPEEEKSRVLAFASYNPGDTFTFDGKEMNIPFMGVQFHNGDFYMYPGVSKSQFDKVVSKATKAKTSGENEWGFWTKGDASRGAGMHELIKELENEFGKNFIKFKASEGYDFWKRFRKELKEYFLRNKRRHI